MAGRFEYGQIEVYFKYDPFTYQYNGYIIKPKQAWIIWGRFFEDNITIARTLNSSSYKGSLYCDSEIIVNNVTYNQCGHIQLGTNSVLTDGDPFNVTFETLASDSSMHQINFTYPLEYGVWDFDVQTDGWDTSRFLMERTMTVNILLQDMNNARLVGGGSTYQGVQHENDCNNCPSGDICSTCEFRDYTGMAVAILGYITAAPTSSPTLAPSLAPTQPPSDAPSIAPMQPPSSSPTSAPISPQPPSNAPSLTPTQSPSLSPSYAPTQPPSLTPSLSPTQPPSNSPSTIPTQPPSSSPSLPPSQSPTLPPSLSPTLVPSSAPTNAPSSDLPCSTSNGCGQFATCDYEFVANKVYGCGGSEWDNYGVSNGEYLCGDGYTICASADRALELGLTVDLCLNASITTDYYYASLAGADSSSIESKTCIDGGVNNLFGCTNPATSFISTSSINCGPLGM